MKKKIFVVFLVLILAFSIPTSAYQITGFELHCDAAMLISLDTNDVLFEKNSDKVIYPASITKLMTAIVMVENISDMENTYITYSKTANNLILGTGSVVYGLKVGEKMQAKEALASLLISSHGDVAYAIAEHVGGTIPNFVQMMNDKAARLGLKNTRFENPVGLHDDEHYTTAAEIYAFAKYAFEIDIIKELASQITYKMKATDVHSERTIANSNMMMNPNYGVYYKPTVCGKTGFTDEAGRCLVSIAEKNGYTYMAIVLNSKTTNGTRWEFIDSQRLYDWAFNNFEYKSIYQDTTPVSQLKVTLSDEADSVQLNLEGGLRALLPKDADTTTIKIVPNLTCTEVAAPVKKGDVYGTADIYYAEEKIGTLNLVAANDVTKSNIQSFVNSAKNTLKKTGEAIPWKILLIILGIIVFGFAAATVYLNLTKKRHRKIKYKPISKDELDD